jgi:Antibiotic biosynthesis monooxygenase
MRYARVAFYEMAPKTIDISIRRSMLGLLPVFRQQPGFVSYQLVKVGERSLVSFSVWETREAAEEANRATADWASENLPDTVVSSRLYIGPIAFDSAVMEPRAPDAYPTI